MLFSKFHHEDAHNVASSVNPYESINAAKYIGPPCKFRYNNVEHKTPEGPCPEGIRWCGIPVWLNFPNVKRPF